MTIKEKLNTEFLSMWIQNCFDDYVDEILEPQNKISNVALNDGKEAMKIQIKILNELLDSALEEAGIDKNIEISNSNNEFATDLIMKILKEK